MGRMIFIIGAKVRIESSNKRQLQKQFSLKETNPIINPVNFLTPVPG
jgi:hypothetical protein